MVNEFNKLVGDILAAEGAVYLPDVGSLAVVRRAAEKISSRRLQRSCNTVLFTDKVRGRSVVDVVAEMCKTDAAEAENIYRRWLSKVKTDGVLLIEGVGHIDRMRFYIDDAFDKLLNPNGHQIVDLDRHRRNNVLLICMWIVLALVATVSVGYCLYECREDISDTVSAWFAPKEKPARSEEIAVIQEPADEDIADDADDTSEQHSGQSEIEQSQAEHKAAEPVNVSEPEPTVEPEYASHEQLTQSAKLSPAAKPSEDIGRLTSGWSYVVYGVFSTPENAMRAVAELRANGISNSSAFAYGSKYMVSLYFSAEAADCNRYIRTALGFEDLWVYTAR